VLPKPLSHVYLIAILLAGWLIPAARQLPASALAAPAEQSGEVTAYDLILAMNTLRVSYGLPALVEDPIVNAVAQSTARIMADNQMSWHIGDVKGRLSAAGYGGGAAVQATENFAVGMSYSIDMIMQMWADPDHMRPAVTAAYCHVGAGTAKAANGRTYYVLQAAYISGKSCGDYTPLPGGSSSPGGSTGSGVSQLIVPVKIATPDAEGKIFHVVEAGQSFWAIAVTYKVTIRDIEIWNNLSKDSKLQIGQKLFIPGSNTEGYATPTPVGMILVSTPDAGGKIIHTVQSHQTLSTISQAYKISIDRILGLNNWSVDWPLQIGQKLLISPGNVTPSPTPRPLTAVEKLTPESDGKYYHTVSSGEYLAWIADLYEVNLFDLMNWNGLNSSSIIKPGQKLVLQVTPPATATFTPGPPTETPSPSHTLPPPTSTRTPPATAAPTEAETQAVSAAAGGSGEMWIAAVGAAAGGALWAVFYFNRRKKS
jgi:LysM repeat protein